RHYRDRGAARHRDDGLVKAGCLDRHGGRLRSRGACRRLRLSPGLAQRLGIGALGLEPADRRREMLITLAALAATGEPGEKQRVDMQVERGDLQPGFDMALGLAFRT